MIITADVLRRFSACTEELPAFERRFPHGVDISPLWGTSQERSRFWRIALADPLLKRQIGWAIGAGVIPARIIADLRRANLRGANLHIADLQRADLRYADLRRADLWGARYNEYTRWPDG